MYSRRESSQRVLVLVFQQTFLIHRFHALSGRHQLLLDFIEIFSLSDLHSGTKILVATQNFGNNINLSFTLKCQNVTYLYTMTELIVMMGDGLAEKPITFLFKLGNHIGYFFFLTISNIARYVHYEVRNNLLIMVNIVIM